MWYVFCQENTEENNQDYTQLINGGTPEQTTVDEFIKHHYTGHINPGVYDQYTENPNGLDWIDLDKKSLIPITTISIGNDVFEIAMDQELKKCYKKYKVHYPADEYGNPAYDWWEHERDENGQLIPLSKEEILCFKEPYEITVYLMHNGKVIGFASDEYGASGVYLQKPYQGKGLGTELIYAYLTVTGRLQRGQKIGQMTPQGYNMTKRLHRKIVEEAIKAGKSIPEKVLKDYPYLQSKEI